MGEIYGATFQIMQRKHASLSRPAGARRDGLLTYASPHNTRSSVAQKSGIEYGFGRVARTTLNVLARARFAPSPPVDTMTRAFAFNWPIFSIKANPPMTGISMSHTMATISD